MTLFSMFFVSLSLYGEYILFHNHDADKETKLLIRRYVTAVFWLRNVY